MIPLLVLKVDKLVLNWIVSGGSRSLIVAANSHEDKEKWKSDLKAAIQEAKDNNDTKTNYLSLKSYSKWKLQIFRLLRYQMPFKDPNT